LCCYFGGHEIVVWTFDFQHCSQDGGGEEVLWYGACGGKGEGKKVYEELGEFMNLIGTFTVADGVPCLRWLDLGGYEKTMKATTEEMDKLLSEW